MKKSTFEILENLIKRYPNLKSLEQNIQNAFEILQNTYLSGGKIFTCGNGGSASDSEHIVGELMKRFIKKRQVNKEVVENLKSIEGSEEVINSLEGAIPSISLTSHLSLSTAFANDNNPSMCFAQQLYGLGNKNDTLIALSTSGNSKNCVYATMVAKAKGIKVIAMTGKEDSKLSKLSNETIKVLETETYKIQELHLPIYHCLCAMLEEENF